MSVKLTRLSNGLIVASDRMDTVESVSVGIYVAAGTRHEGPAENGVAHLLEHMAFKGTTTRSARDIAEQVEAVGGYMNAATGREQTAYYVKLLKEDLALGVELIADIILNSVYDPAELERERGVILQELGQVEDTPDDVIFDHFHEVAYPGQALGRPVLGKAEIIRAIPREAVMGFQQRRYGGQTMVLAAAGRLDHDVLVALAEKAFAKLPPRAEAHNEAARFSGGAFRAASDLEQVHLVLGFPAVSYTDPDYYAVQVLATLLGGGMSSRLFQELRENRGLCYAVSSFAASYVDGGVFGIYTGTGDDSVAEMMPVLAEQLRGVRHAITPGELGRARAQMKAGLLMSLESPNARADALGGQMLIFGRPISPEETAARIDAVSADDVLRAARRVFAGAPVLAAMGPLDHLESDDQLFARLAG